MNKNRSYHVLARDCLQNELDLFDIWRIQTCYSVTWSQNPQEFFAV